MFQRSTAAAHSTRLATRGLNNNQTKNNENSSLPTKSTLAVKSHTSSGLVRSAAGTTASLVNRKRRVLGDVSNQVAAPAVGGKDKAVPAKTLVKTVKPSTTTSNQEQRALRVKPTKATAVTATAKTLIKKSATSVVLKEKKTKAVAAPVADDAHVKKMAVKEKEEKILQEISIKTDSDKENSPEKENRVLLEELKSQTVIEEREEICVPEKAKNKKEQLIRARQEVEVEEKEIELKEEELQSESKRQRTSEIESEWDDLDADDFEDPMMVSEYVVEIFEYLRKLELTVMPDPNYMDSQKELQWKARTVLINWLVELHEKFKLLPETLFLTVNIIDRFLSVNPVSLNKIQLVGITSLFIAAKYEEVYVPSISQFVYFSDENCNHEDIVHAERYILSSLEFSLQMPNPLNFLRRCSKADNYNLTTRTIAKYFMESMLLHHEYIVYPPSLTSAVSLCLARIMVLPDAQWNANMKHYSGYKFSELRECLTKLMKYFMNDCRKTNAVDKKFSGKQYMRVAKYVEEWFDARGECLEFIELADPNQ